METSSRTKIASFPLFHNYVLVYMYDLQSFKVCGVIFTNDTVFHLLCPISKKITLHERKFLGLWVEKG